MGTRSLLATLMLAMALTLGACDSDGDGGGIGTPGDLQSGRCSQSQATQPCSGDCAFDPASIDCGVACQNVADACASDQCGAECADQDQNVADCTASCEAAKGFQCANVSFGCWASHDSCQSVASCFLSNM